MFNIEQFTPLKRLVRQSEKQAIYAIFFISYISVLGSLWVAYLVGLDPKVVAITSVFIYMLLCAYLWISQKLIIILFFPFFVMQFSALVSSAYLEFGGYISEVNQVTYATGSTIRLFTLQSIFILSAVTVFSLLSIGRIKKKAERLGDISSRQFYIIILGFCIGILIFTMNGVIQGTPITKMITRFDYWAVIEGGSWLKRLLTLFNSSYIMLGGLLGSNNERQINRTRILLIIYLIGVLVNIAYGEKFSGIITLSASFLIGYLMVMLINNKLKISIIRVSIVGALLIGVFYFLITWSYINLHHYGEEQVKQIILHRIIELQGQVWWAMDNYLQHNYGGKLGDFVKANKEESSGGIFLLMEVLSPASTFASYSSKKVPFTMGYPAIAVYSVGYFWSALIQAAAGVFTAFVAIYLSKKVLFCQPIRFLLASVLYLMCTWAFNLGSVYVLFTNTVLFCLLIAVIDLIIVKERHVNICSKCRVE